MLGRLFRRKRSQYQMFGWWLDQVEECLADTLGEDRHLVRYDTPTAVAARYERRLGARDFANQVIDAFPAARAKVQSRHDAMIAKARAYLQGRVFEEIEKNGFYVSHRTSSINWMESQGLIKCVDDSSPFHRWARVDDAETRSAAGAYGLLYGVG